PLEHGMAGYRLYLRETSSITNMIRFSMHGGGAADSALSAGLALDSLFPGQTFHQRMAAQSVAAHAVLPQYIAASGLSSALYRGSTSSHPAAGLSDMLVTARHLLNHAESRAFVSVYWPGLDTVAHVRGPDTDAYVAELRAVDDAIRRELVGRVKNTLLVFTSDHGFVSMRLSDYLQLQDRPEIGRAMLLPPVGEPRASYFFARNGAQDRLAKALGEVARDGLVVLSPEELLATRLLGTGNAHPEIENRIGDLAVVATGRAGIFHAYPDAIMLRGMHGGLTEAEMLVPLIVSPL
ncbi:alkaline phosphatase family protein, partial [Candidatus Bipolaricaulota bacterium]|nr:alkaline phosphatase family protein [Candidatus Bipolaricaulota bacterium]